MDTAADFLRRRGTASVSRPAFSFWNLQWKWIQASLMITSIWCSPSTGSAGPPIYRRRWLVP